MTIFYFDALAGAGKTRALAHYADRRARLGHKILFVQPTKHLINKTIVDELGPLQPTYPYGAIHGGSVSDEDGVVASIMAHLKGAVPDQGEILFITHAALMRVPFLYNANAWHLIMDEVPEAAIFEEVRLPDTGHVIMPFLDLVPEGAVYGRLRSVKPAKREVA